MSIDYRDARVDLAQLANLEVSAAAAATSGVELVALTEAHHAWAARLHVEELPHGLFPSLGPRFVAQWHRAHMASPHGLGYVALKDGRPIGFALGCTDRRANVDWLLAHRWAPLAAAASRAFARRPLLAAWFIRSRSVRYLRRLVGRVLPTARPAPAAKARRTGAEPSMNGSPAVLEAIIVVPSVRAQGVGSTLVDRFLADTAEAGAEYAELVTKDGDRGAAGFYERGGWLPVGRHTDRDGDDVLTFRIKLRSALPR